MRKSTLLWILALCAVAVLSAGVTAQVTSGPRVLSGGDIGFRLEGTDMRGRPSGTLVVRLNNEWVEVGAAVRPTPATSR